MPKWVVGRADFGNVGLELTGQEFVKGKYLPGGRGGKDDIRGGARV